MPCLVDRNGVQGCYVGDLPEQCAALNRTNINVQLLTIEAALTRKRDKVYQAAMLDPHTAAELTPRRDPQPLRRPHRGARRHDPEALGRLPGPARRRGRKDADDLVAEERHAETCENQPRRSRRCG